MTALVTARAIRNLLVRNSCVAHLRTNTQMQVGHEHGPRQLIVTKYPLKTFNQRVSRVPHIVTFGALQKRRRHSILMNRINFVIIKNSSALCIKKPGPLAIGALQVNQLAYACIGDLDAVAVLGKLTVGITGDGQVRLTGKRCKSPTKSGRPVKK